jgi:hypothetical protein
VRSEEKRCSVTSCSLTTPTKSFQIDIIVANDGHGHQAWSGEAAHKSGYSTVKAPQTPQQLTPNHSSTLQRQGITMLIASAKSGYSVKAQSHRRVGEGRGKGGGSSR